MEKNNIVFFGTPHFVTHVLDALYEQNLAPSLVVTQPDRPAGRGLLPKASAVKTWAQEKNIPTAEPEKINVEFIQTLSGYDLFIVAGYGKILPKELLALPKFGALNVHPSLLPKYRGPSPIETQILDDAKTVGVSIILLDQETDHGPLVAQKSFAPEKWPLMRSELETLLWSEGGNLLAESIPAYIEAQTTPREQNHAEATFTPKLSKDDGLLDLSGDPYKNYLKYCAYEGWPGTYFFVERNGKKIRLKITNAEFTGGEFKILRVIPEGKKEMDYASFARGV